MSSFRYIELHIIIIMILDGLTWIGWGPLPIRIVEQRPPAEIATRPDPRPPGTAVFRTTGISVLDGAEPSVRRGPGTEQ